MQSDKLKNYLDLLHKWMQYFGFEQVVNDETLGMDRIYSRYRTDIAKFGKCSTYSCNSLSAAMQTQGWIGFREFGRPFLRAGFNDDAADSGWGG